MNPRDLARSYAGGRVVLGLLLVLFPGRLIRDFIPAPGRTGKAVARMLGARDAVIGAGTLVALQDESAKIPVRPWMTYGAVCDAVDAFGMLLSYRHLPRYKRFLFLVMAVAGTATGGYLMTTIDD